MLRITKRCTDITRHLRSGCLAVGTHGADCGVHIGRSAHSQRAHRRAALRKQRLQGLCCSRLPYHPEERVSAVCTQLQKCSLQDGY